VESKGRGAVGSLVCWGGACAGITVVRWYLAETGLRRSKMRMCESEETHEMMEGLVGEKAAE
jgi:hypothetical protein